MRCSPRLGRSRLSERQALGLGDVPPDRDTRQAHRASDGTLTLLGLPATDNFSNVHAAELPITHAAPFFWDVMVQNGAAGGL